MRYIVKISGFWSFIVDTQTNKIVSHDYDLECDADYYCDEMNDPLCHQEKSCNGYIEGCGICETPCTTEGRVICHYKCENCS